MHCCAINTRCLPQYPWEPETSLPYIILQILYYLEVNISNQTLFLNTIRQKYRRRNLGPSKMIISMLWLILSLLSHLSLE